MAINLETQEAPQVHVKDFKCYLGQNERIRIHAHPPLPNGTAPMEMEKMWDTERSSVIPPSWMGTN